MDRLDRFFRGVLLFSLLVTHVACEADAKDSSAGSTDQAGAPGKVGGAGIKVTQGDKSYTLKTGSTVNFKYLQLYDKELDPAGAKDTDKILGFYIRASGATTHDRDPHPWDRGTRARSLKSPAGPAMLPPGGHA